MEIDWTEFLGRPAATVDSRLAASVVAGKRVLITGAGGSIGSGLARAVLSGHPRSLVVLDSSEHALYESYRRLESIVVNQPVELTPVVASIRDSVFLSHLFDQHRPDLIFHAAAYKHVPLMEKNPFSAITNNPLGTYSVAVAAAESGVARLIMISTDKAVNPGSVMGLSKRVAELILLSHSTNATHMNSIRLGNVLGSSGSVVSVFCEQAIEGRPLTVTDPGASRYFITSAEAEIAILQAAGSAVSAKILIANCGEPMRIVDLARYIAKLHGAYADGEARFQFIGLRPGDKLREELVSSEEMVESELVTGMRIVSSPAPSSEEMKLAMNELEMVIDRFDRSALMDLLTKLVPSYLSSEQVAWTQTEMEAR